MNKILNLDLDRNSAVPLYYQIYSTLKSAIEEGVYKPNERLLNETELMEKFGVSRATVRLALQKLEYEGLILRKQGKGTLVLPPKINVKITNLFSFSKELERLGYRPGTQLLKKDYIRIDQSIAKELQLTPKTKVLRLIRLRTADELPVGICTSYLNLPEFPEVQNQDYTQLSLYEIIEKKIGLKIIRAEERIVADIASRKEATLLGLKANSPVLRIYRTTYVQGNIPIETVYAVFNAKVYSFYTELFC